DRPTKGTDANAENDGAGDGAGDESPESAGSEDVIDAAIDAGDAEVPAADRHVPVEGFDAKITPDQPAGRLLPDGDVRDCAATRDITVSGTCEPKKPVRGEGCTDDDIAAARSPLDQDNTQHKRERNTGRVPVLEVDSDSLLPRRPRMIGVQCFDVPLGADSRVLSLHLRDVGHILTADDARPSKASLWSKPAKVEAFGSGSSGIFAALRRTASARGASLEYGTGRLIGSHDIVVEGEFGAGIGLTSGFVTGDGASEEAQQLDPTELATLRGSADGFSQIVRSVPLNGSISVDNTAGTDISIARVFARPRDLPPSCDMPIALTGLAQREVRITSALPGGGDPIERPGLAMTIVSIDQNDDGARVARVAVASYLSRAGLPRYVLADWTEQFDQGIRIEACDGVVTDEDGAEPDGGDEFIDPTDLAGALAERADEIRTQK
ncbi:MAG: hypothetical protein ABI200_08200, partial [Gaiellales bacterium]